MSFLVDAALAVSAGWQWVPRESRLVGVPQGFTRVRPLSLGFLSVYVFTAESFSRTQSAAGCSLNPGLVAG